MKMQNCKFVHIWKFLVIILVTISFQSCYSYREVSMNSVAANKQIYKIKEGYDQRKIKIIAVKDSSLVVEDWEGQRETKKGAIAKIKLRQFDSLLTVGVVLGSLLLVLPVAIFLIYFP